MQAIGQVGQYVVSRQVGHLRFDAPVLGNVLMRGDPASIGHAPLLDGDDTPVTELAHFRDGSVIHHGFEHVARILFDRPSHVEAVGYSLLHDRAEGCAGLGQVFGQAIHLGIAGIADHQLLLAVEHAQGLRHVVERGVETQILHLELIFLFEQLPLLCLQALQGAVERGERQPSKAVVGCQAQDQECQGGMQRTKENLARADGYMEVAMERGGVDFCLLPRVQATRPERP